MIVLDPRSGEHVEILVPHRHPTPRQQEREARKTALLSEKERIRAARWMTLRRDELDSGAL